MQYTVQTRYSLAFKLKVVNEIELGVYSINDAKKTYGIPGGQTISNWLTRYGKNPIFGKIVRIEMKDEKDVIRELNTKVKMLEKALSRANVTILIQEEESKILAEILGYDLDEAKKKLPKT